LTPHHLPRFSLLTGTLRSLFVTIRTLLGNAGQKLQRSAFAGQVRRADRRLFGVPGSSGRPRRLTLGAAAVVVVIAGLVAGLTSTAASASAGTGLASVAGQADQGHQRAHHASGGGHSSAASFRVRHASATSGDHGSKASGDHTSKSSGQQVSTTSGRAASGHSGSGATSRGHASKQPGQHATAARHSGHGRDQATKKSAGHSGRPASGQHKAAPAAPKKPFLIYDSVTPSAIPAHRPVATYATGAYAAQPSQVAGHHPVLWIDTNGSDPHASVLDVEPGDATPATAASWAFHRLKEDPHALARIYTMRSEWGATQAAIHGLPSWMHSHIRWWIADPTGVPHIVPGSDATQWYWGSHYDITTASPRF
jgi:hypothetical protein